MCDYRHESKKAVKNLPVPLERVHKFLPNNAYQVLIRAIQNGYARPGRDLQNGQPLSRNSLSMGHYMSPRSYEKALSRMNSKPWKCHWCGNPLPRHLIDQHRIPHNHREYIQHHFHQRCWDARLLAIAIIFGHLTPEDLFHQRRYRPPKTTKYHSRGVSRIEIIKETFKIF